MLIPGAWAAQAIVREILAPGSALGADPGEALVLHFGEWGLRVLLLTLLLSSVQRMGWWHGAVRLRRMTGLFAFAYVALHLLGYVAFLAAFSWREVLADLAERPYITVGFAAFLLLVPLTITSTRAWQRRLRQAWKRLHRLVYPALGLALLHLWWLTRDGYGELLAYTVIFALLLAERWWTARRA